MAQDWKAPSYAKPVDEKETVDSSTWNKRPDGSTKGKGFLGVFKLPNGEAASEYSIADSEKLKDAKGNYLDYPSLVPTLTKDELRQALDAANRGVQPPDSVKIKAEAYALERKKAGKPLFANDGEQNESLHSDIPRLNVTNSDTDNSEEEWQPPSYAKAEEEPGVLDKIGEFAAKHPKTREIAERLLTGTSAEHEKLFKNAGIRNGANAQEGSLLPDWKSQPENYWGGFAKSIYNDFVKPLGTPSGILGSSGPAKIPFKVGEVVPDLNYPLREPISDTKRLLGPARTTVSPKGNAYVGELPIRASKEVPYKSPESYSTVFDTKDKSQIKPKINVPESGDLPIKQDPIAGMDTFHKASFTAVGDEDIFNADRPRQGVGDVEQTLYDHNKKKLGGKQTDDSPLVLHTENSDIFNHEPDIKGYTLMTGERVRDLYGMEPKEAISKGIVKQDPETLAYRAVQDNKPTAIYAFEQPGLNGESTSMYHIKDGDYDRSTVSGKRLEELGIDVPDRIDPSSDKPAFARSEKGGIKVGVNIARTADELASGYSNPLPGIMAREGLQNAIDATRHLGSNARITVDASGDGITISDNGKGMNREELETVFSDLHSSGKTSESGATGGKGIGKATYMLGGEHFTATSVKLENGKKIEYSIQGTPAEFMKHVDIDEREVPLSTPTGTIINTKLKPSQDIYTAKDMVRKIIRSTRGVKGEIAYKAYNYENFVPNKFSQGETDNLVGKTNIEGHDVSVSIPGGQTLEPKTSITVEVLNNGMYQYDKYMSLREETPNMPDTIIVDIHPNAEEGTPEYPFPTQRESLKQSMQEKLDAYIQEKLIKPEQQGRKNVLKELYASMPVVPSSGTHRPTVFFDPGEKLTKSELEDFLTSPVINELTSIVDRTIDHILKIMNNKDWSSRLERIGIVLDPNMHGVHIPNPETKKSTILINPFIHIDEKNPVSAALQNIVTIMHEVAHIGTEWTYTGGGGEIAKEELRDPRIGEYLQSYLEQSMKQGGLDSSHGINFLKRLGDVYAKYGAKNALSEADKVQQILTDRAGKYNPEVQRLLQLYKDSRGRAETKTDFLSGTGTKQGVKRGGKGSVSSDDNSNGKRTTAAVRKLLDALQQAKELNIEQEQINRKERAKRFGAFESVKAEGQEGAAKSLSKLRGRYEKVEGNRLQLDQKDVDTLFTAIKNANITTPEKIQSYVALFKLIDGGNALQRNEIRTLDDVFGDGFAERIIHLQGGIGAVGIKVAKVANTMKSMLTLIHLSAPLRQGIGLIHKPAYREAFVEMFKFLGNKERYDAAMKAIEEDPMYLLLRQGGLFLAKTNSMLDGEEQFLNNYIPNLPSGVKSLGLKNVYDASQRSYLGFLNVLRFQTAKDLINDAKKFGHHAFTVEESVEDGEVVRKVVPSKSTENIAKFVNISTGRGSLGFLDKITPEINTVIWSPRLIASRLTVLNPRYYWTMDSFTRKEAIKSLLAIAAASSAMIGLAKLAGGKVSNDPTSADFHKARFKNSVLDPNGGFQQPVVAAARMINEVNRMSHGRKAGYTEENIPEIAVNFIRSKESPMAGLIDDLASAKYFTGSGGYVNRFGARTSVQTEITNRFRPIFEQDMTKLLQDDQDFMTDLGLSAANLFGAGLQDYPEKHPKGSLSMNKLRVR